MKKIIISTALLLAMIFSLASCSFGGGLKTKSILVAENYEEPVSLKSAEKVTSLNGKTTDGGYYNLMRFNDEDNYYVYNLLTGNKVFGVSKEKSASISVSDVYFTVTITEDDETKTTLYDANGNVLASKDESVSASYLADDLFVFDDKVYRFDDETLAVTLVKTYGPFEKKVFDLYSNGAYYYNLRNENYIQTYDQSLNLISTWMLPFDVSQAKYDDVCFLSNGNYIVQVIETLPDSFEDFSYVEGGVKKLVTTFLVSPDGDYKTIDADYVIDELECVANDDYYNYLNAKKVRNIAIIKNFEDGRLGATERLVAISDSGKVTEMFTDLDEFGLPYYGYQVNKDVFCYETVTGSEYYVDAEGNVIGEVSGLSSSGSTEDFFVTDGVVYDYNLNKLFDLNEKGLEVSYVLNHTLILYNAEEKEYYLYTGANSTKLLDVDAITTAARNYYITKDGDTYTVYNDLGEKLFSTSDTSAPTVVISDSDAGYVLFSIRDGEDYIYYKAK